MSVSNGSLKGYLQLYVIDRRLRVVVIVVPRTGWGVAVSVALGIAESDAKSIPSSVATLACD